jgi:membrane protease YdiL (CAAX protease family)
MGSYSDFLKVFFVIAVLPALGEEMLFRGLLMKFAKKHSKSMVLPLVITSLLFAGVHFNVYGFVSLFFAGLLLGLVYYLTGSLWCSILFHLIINGSQIALLYFGNGNKTIKDIIESNTLPAYIPLVSLLVFAGSFYMLIKNKTPLPEGWEKDFTAEELATENKEDNPINP